MGCRTGPELDDGEDAPLPGLDLGGGIEPSIATTQQMDGSLELWAARRWCYAGIAALALSDGGILTGIMFRTASV